MEHKMDVKKFINLVYGYKCLWDHSDSTYLLRDHQGKAWQEISEEIGLPVPDLKRKWRGLRDTFVKELRKLNSNHSGLEGDVKPESKWAYFTQLLFLYNTIARRDLNVLDIEYVGQNIEQPPERTKRKRHKRNAPDEIDKDMMEIEHEKFKLYQQNINDPDAQFLMSLLPFLQDIPKHRKLVVRSKLQEVFMNEENELSAAVKSEETDDSSDSSDSA